MTASTLSWRQAMPSMAEGKWIYHPRWDLVFISLSVILVPLPYLIWIFMGEVLQVESDAGRQAVNLLIAGLIGGPHMYATFTRTALDHNFRDKHRSFVLSSAIIPLVVITLALTNLTLLLTVFFFWASLHVLHQILFVVETYNTKEKAVAPVQARPGLMSRAIDYAVVLTSLYPIAAYRIAIAQDFAIGPTNLNDAIPAFFEQPWVFYMASLAFGVSVAAFVIKTIVEIRAGTAHVPKIIFISLTAAASFIVPSLGNLDTAFQGMNVWHSFQYLALTWYINRLRRERGDLKSEPLLQRISESGRARLYYGFLVVLTMGAVVIIGIVFVILNQLVGGKWAEPSFALETSYYIGVLSFLWVHYYHDHFLFTQPKAVLA